MAESISVQKTKAAGALNVRWLGRIEYNDAWDLQRNLARRRAAGDVSDTLLLLEHDPVYTSGRRDLESNLRVSPRALGAPLIESDRGGDITFHGPGQLIAYPIIDLKAAGLGVVSYVRGLEQAIIRTLLRHGIEGETICNLTGVWVGGQKIAAIGVRVGRPLGGAGPWITTHGAALNVDVDLAWFESIVPCGIADRGVTSMMNLTGTAPSLKDVGRVFAEEFGNFFGHETVTSEW